MINPRSLVRALDKHWEIIEYLVALGREHIAFERDEILSLLAKVYPDSSRKQCIAPATTFIPYWNERSSC